MKLYPINKHPESNDPEDLVMYIQKGSHICLGRKSSTTFLLWLDIAIYHRIMNNYYEIT